MTLGVRSNLAAQWHWKIPAHVETQQSSFLPRWIVIDFHSLLFTFSLPLLSLSSRGGDTRESEWGKQQTLMCFTRLRNLFNHNVSAVRYVSCVYSPETIIFHLLEWMDASEETSPWEKSFYFLLHGKLAKSNKLIKRIFFSRFAFSAILFTLTLLFVLFVSMC